MPWHSVKSPAQLCMEHGPAWEGSLFPRSRPDAASWRSICWEQAVSAKGKLESALGIFKSNRKELSIQVP